MPLEEARFGCVWWWGNKGLLGEVKPIPYAPRASALQFAGPVLDILGVRVDPLDEIGCLVKGLGFLMVHVPSEAYTFAQAQQGQGGQAPQGQDVVDRPMEGVTYPYLLANIGSGEAAESRGERVHRALISIRSAPSWCQASASSSCGLRPTGSACLEPLSGAEPTTGFATCVSTTLTTETKAFFHLLFPELAVTGLTSFDEMLNQAELGDNERVDLTVGDIYGGKRAHLSSAA